MTTGELRQGIHQLVDSVQNEVTLIDIHRVIALHVEQQDMPLDDDEPILRERMSRLTGQLERGEYITNEAMK
ncbi:hypothetical protein J2I47_20960 [Fibrella sp. HMF5335]|uniref:Uncharacterized protein n=1 Tax=Fibrella rubiginis TaxID=2817060 RepID=A0A939K3A4_9BACT|nr:hypothetical protein [Fibrella rubiginis]MBO0939037.1 hypothetical protein [Fibrella rubiginis]